LEAVCLKCLEKEPSNRYSSASALAEDLDRFLGGLPILARPVGPIERVIKWARRSPFQAALAGAVIVCIALLVIVLALKVKVDRQDTLLRNDPQPETAPANSP